MSIFLGGFSGHSLIRIFHPAIGYFFNIFFILKILSSLAAALSDKYPDRTFSRLSMGRFD